MLFAERHCALQYAMHHVWLHSLADNPEVLASMTMVFVARTARIPSIPKHFKQNGYHVAGGGKIYHHMPGLIVVDWDDTAQTLMVIIRLNCIWTGHSDFHFPPGFPPTIFRV